MTTTHDAPTTTDRYYAPVPSSEGTWDMLTYFNELPSMIMGEVLADLADADERIVCLTADLAYSNRTADFMDRHPERFYNIGISEQNMISMSAGMATTGLIPYVSTFASFVGLLCCEQIRTDLAYTNLPVRVLSHHAGISMGFYGTSHHATEDLGIMRSIHNLTVIGTADGPSLRKALIDTVDIEGPVYFRIGRGQDVPVYDEDASGFEVGKISVLRDGTDLTIAANGITVSEALKVADELAAQGVSASVLDVHTIAPFDADTLCEHVARSGRLLVAEEHNVYTGVATACADALVDAGIGPVRLERLGMPRGEFALIAAPYHLYKHYGMTSEGILARAQNLL